MSETTDEQLRRVFAQGAPVQAEESFVAEVAVQVAARRVRQRYRKFTLMALCAVTVGVLAAWLAPYAPVTLPEQIADTAQLDVSRVPLYLYLVLAAAVLPLAGTAWLVRRR